jgi:Tfp pilus assembly protein PilF
LDANPPPAGDRPLRSRLIALLREHKGVLAGSLLLLLSLATFWPALRNDFVGYDDPDYVTANPHVQQGLSWETVRWAFSNTQVAAWHPLAWLSHALDYECFALQPWGHHLTAILLHALNAALSFFVLRGLTGSFGRSWAVAALFALHPLRVESVVWVSERKDVLSMVFFLLTLWAYSRYTIAAQAGEQPAANSQKSGGPPSLTFRFSPFKFHASRCVWFLSLALLFYVLGLMSKPMLVTLPFVLLLLDAWPLNRWASRGALALVKEKIPFFVAALGVSLVTVLAQPHGNAMPGGPSLGPRLENAAVSCCRYLGKFFWPVRLAPFYPPVERWPLVVWIGAALLLLVITFAAMRMRHSQPYLLVGWLWFLGTLVPVIGLVQIGEQSIADRYSYLPSLGILLGLVWGITDLTAPWRFRRAALATTLSALLTVCFLLTQAQVAVWQNTETLFRHTLSVTRGNYLAHNNLGVVLEQQGHWADAIHQYELALELKPGYPEALDNLGIVFDRIGQLGKAEEFFQAALRQRQDFAAARNGLGLVYQKQDRFQDAAQQFQEALKIKPDYADAHFNLAVELERQGRLDQAAVEFQTTLKLQPYSADVHSNLGVLLEKQGRLDQAIQQYVAAIRLNPNFARAYFNLGVVLAKKGLVKDAIGAFETALRLRPDYPAARTNLALLKSLGP